MTGERFTGRRRRDPELCPSCGSRLAYDRRQRPSAASRKAKRDVLVAACTCGYRHARVLPIPVGR